MAIAILAPSCPQCNAKKVFNDGHRIAYGVTIQRFRCRTCGCRFSEDTKQLKTKFNNLLGSQQNNPCKEIDLLAALTENESAGNNTQKGYIVEYKWKMQKRGLTLNTIYNRAIWLTKLVKLGADLKNPETVEIIFATETLTPATKMNMVNTYATFAKLFKITWEKPRNKYQPKQPFEPLEEEIDQLILKCGKVTSAFLQLLKDTGARAGEARKIQWTEINEKNLTIQINCPEKGSNSRTVKVTEKTISMLKNLPKKHGDYIFSPKCGSLVPSFSQTRKALAIRQQNPRLLKIHFHTLRHWRASREYERTGDIYAVKALLGHKSIVNTDRYQHGSFSNEEYTCKRPTTSQEEDQLINAGFQFVRFDDKEQVPIYRKRK